MSVLYDGYGNEITTLDAETAKKFKKAIKVQTNLSERKSADLDGSGDVSPGVSGTLSTINGGTGVAVESLVALLQALGGVAKSGDTMTGGLTVPKVVVQATTNPATAFHDADGNQVGYLNYVTNQGRLCLFQQKSGQTAGEGYLLPTPTDGLSANQWYQVLTTKTFGYGTEFPEHPVSGQIFLKIQQDGGT